MCVCVCACVCVCVCKTHIETGREKKERGGESARGRRGTGAAGSGSADRVWRRVGEEPHTVLDWTADILIEGPRKYYQRDWQLLQ
jgi:hypothetical protein